MSNITLDISESSPPSSSSLPSFTSLSLENGIIEPMKYQMFMAHIPTNDISSVEQILLTYKIGQYLICGETTPYDHLHFMVEMTDTTYHAFSKRLFKDKYKLRGRAVKGKARQYGKQKKIKDLEKALAYTVKMYKQHPDLCKTNMTNETIHKYVELSYLKKEEKKPHEIYIERLTKLQPEQYETTRNLIILWMELCPKTRPPLFRSLLWYAYQAKYITQSTFINDYYNVFNFSTIQGYPLQKYPHNPTLYDHFDDQVESDDEA